MKKLFPWLGAAVIITIVFGTMYGLTQQSLRLSANDPQIETAQRIASELDNGAQLPTDKPDINIATALDTYFVAYNKAGKPLAGTGELNGKLPTIPKGVLTAADHQSYSAVTWQPASGIRDAAVTVAAKDYYVVSARSLAQVESRESSTLHLAGYGWTASIVVLILIYGLPFTRRGQKVSDTTAYVAPSTRSSRPPLK